MKKYSKQREAVLTVLRSTDTHPTANWIYSKVREQLPNISLGTVYRNLSQLTSDGDILSINVGDGFEHFDGNSMPHLHLHCKQCGNIIDVTLQNDTLSEIAASNGFYPETSIYVICGICENCKNLNQISGGN